MVDEEEGRAEGPSESAPHPIYNWMSFIGASLAAVSATIAAFFFVIDTVTQEATGYAGLALLPPLLATLIGLVLFVAGWLRERWRQRHGRRSSFFEQWVVDPFAFVRRRGIPILLGGIALATLSLLTAGAGSVAVVEYSESNSFCSNVCHQVMHPEAIAHKSTAHSMLHCVDCHVGAGAEGFLEAKLGGLRQLWAVTGGSVQRPIPTPIHGGTISRELCEGCHARERYIGYKSLTRRYFLSGMEDMPVELAMVVKVGGGSQGLVHASGIHYHMQIAEKVEFIARDDQRQEIAWVRITGGNGNVREYSSESAPLTEAERASLPVRQMECIDCHSRAAHAFRAPMDTVNAALALGRLPADLSMIKEASVRALDGDYESTEEAMVGIGQSLREYYEEEDPDVLEEQAVELEQASNVLRDIYRQTIFPEMKADWRAHPNNIGHRDSLGCFRCHNDDLTNGDGRAIFTDCSRCHAVLAQDDQSIRAMAEFDRGMDFLHPQDSSTFEEFTYCSDCHDGGKGLYE